MFPYIRAAMPLTTLRVYSSMKVYQIDSDQDEANFGELYRRCREIEGIEYIGSLPQPELAQELRSVTALAYPNTFAETCCIAVTEAMASGCIVISSELGALPQTGAEFAHLIPVNDDWPQYAKRFIAEVVYNLQTHSPDETSRAERRLEQQVSYVNQHHTWSARVLEWVALLEELSEVRSERVPSGAAHQ
jgi:glycosyltransferase involved in cell wall biosynthesis